MVDLESRCEDGGVGREGERELGGVSSRKMKATAESTSMWNADGTNTLQVNRVDSVQQRGEEKPRWSLVEHFVAK